MGYDDDDDENDPIHDKWEAVNDDFLKFDRIDESQRPYSSSDVCAFVYLDRLFPSEKGIDMVAGAEHDEIYLRIEEDQVARLTDADILYLTRCGVRYDSEFSGLAMFV